MNQQILDSYGSTFLDEFENKAGNNIFLYNIFEGNFDQSTEKKYSKVEFINFNCIKHQKFLKFFSPLYEAKGVKIIQKINSNNKAEISIKKDFRFDAIKFSYKVFAINYIKNLDLNGSYLIWTDADLRCKKNFNIEDLALYLPEKNELMSYLGRNSFPTNNPYSECGFLGFNVKHESFTDFLERMTEIYLSGEIFSHQEWHDSWIWDRVREEFQEKKIKFKNISGKFSNTEHPFVNCGLQEFFDHLKGPERKKRGQSFDSDYVG